MAKFVDINKEAEIKAQALKVKSLAYTLTQKGASANLVENLGVLKYVYKQFVQFLGDDYSVSNYVSISKGINFTDTLSEVAYDIKSDIKSLMKKLETIEALQKAVTELGHSFSKASYADAFPSKEDKEDND